MEDGFVYEREREKTHSANVLHVDDRAALKTAGVDDAAVDVDFTAALRRIVEVSASTGVGVLRFNAVVADADADSGARHGAAG